MASRIAGQKWTKMDKNGRKVLNRNCGEVEGSWNGTDARTRRGNCRPDLEVTHDYDSAPSFPSSPRQARPLQCSRCAESAGQPERSVTHLLERAHQRTPKGHRCFFPSSAFMFPAVFHILPGFGTRHIVIVSLSREALRLATRNRQPNMPIRGFQFGFFPSANSSRGGRKNWEVRFEVHFCQANQRITTVGRLDNRANISS